MKKSKMVILVLLTMVLGSSLASAFTKTVKVNLWDAAHSSVAVDYETKFDEKYNLIVGGRLIGFSGFGGTAGLRYYLEPGKMEGMYAEGRVLAHAIIGAGSAFGATALATGGYKYVMPNGLTFDGGLGLGLGMSVLSVAGLGSSFGVSFAHDIRLGVGYSW